MGSCLVGGKEHQKESSVESNVKTIKLLRQDKTTLNTVKITTPKPVIPTVTHTKFTRFSEHVGILVDPLKFASSSECFSNVCHEGCPYHQLESSLEMESKVMVTNTDASKILSGMSRTKNPL